MGAISSIVAIAGVGLAAAGTVTNISASKKQNQANQQAIAAQQQAEALRLEAMKMDADRRRRQEIRQMIISRSQALAMANSQGASQSSALPGAFGQISGRAGFGFEGINIAERTGHGIFDANQNLFQARLKANSANQLGQIGSGLTSLGGAFLTNSTAIGNLSAGFGQSAFNFANFGNTTGSGFMGSGAPLA